MKSTQNILECAQITPPSGIMTASNDPPSRCDAEFLAIKQSINEAKSLMDGKDSAWYMRFRQLDPYLSLKKSFPRDVDCVSNAWYKYYELISHFGLINQNTAVCFFNAELPGAAILAANHFATSNGLQFDWFAASLLPAKGENTALGDNHGIYRLNRNHWLMQDFAPNKSDTKSTKYSNNGDTTNIDNILDYAARIGPTSSVGGVDFYSSDAGMDASQNYNNQENINGKLHLGAAIAGLCTMRLGANFIIKQYSFIERHTRDLIVIYSTLFDEFFVAKPATSRAANSETYLIGRGFRGFTAELLELLVDRLVNYCHEPLIMETPTHFELLAFQKVLAKKQVAAIKEAVIAADTQSLDTIRRRMCEKHATMVNDWLQLYPVGSIPRNKNIKHARK